MNSSLLIFAAAFVAAVSANAVYPAVAHLGPVTTQYHSQDEWGQYAYGYSGGPSAKHEQRTADGVTSGGYSYVDANGLVQSVAYVSDPHNGFRATGTNFPVDTAPAPAAPVVPVVHDVVPAPTPVAVHPWPAVVAAAPEPVALPTVVEARNYLYPVHHIAPQPLLKLSKPVTPAGTTNLHYPEHAVILAARKKRSAGLYPYPLVSTYAAAPHHVVTVKHTEFAAPPAPVLHHVIAPAPYVAVHHAPAPAPVATSYTSVVHHHQPEHVPAPEPVIAYAAAPVAVPAPVPHVYVEPHVAVLPTKSQYHSQDEHGQYTYGYTDGASAKTETRYADGVTKGSYSYVDDHGEVQAVHYSAGADGFKAAGTNIPVHHV